MEGRDFLLTSVWAAVNVTVTSDANSSWSVQRAGRAFLSFVEKYAVYVVVPHFKPTSVFGFAVLVNMITQFYSGLLLSLYYTPDPTTVMTLREEFINEIWWFIYVYKLHLVGVDSIFVLSYLHIAKKIYIKNFMYGDVDGWVTGTYAFLFYHVVVFLGITLSDNHLGDLTLTIGANIFWSLFAFEHKAYSLAFTNKHLNVEQLVRFMVAHYCTAWYYLFLVQSHVLYIHEVWTMDSGYSAPQDTPNPKASWALDALQKESLLMATLYCWMMTWATKHGHPDVLPVNFTFFEQWAEVEMEDINFYIVGPHWYFRPHMGLLTICAQHYEGVFWLGMYYVILALMPLWAKFAQNPDKIRILVPDMIPMRSSLLQRCGFILFIGSLVYLVGTLPCARFYYDSEEGFFGNSLLRLSYQYIYLYLLLVIHWLDRFERWVVSYNETSLAEDEEGETAECAV